MSGRTDIAASKGQGARRWLASAGGIAVERLLLFLALLALWEFYARAIADPSQLPPPSAVLRAMATRILGDPRLVAALGVSLFELATAYALSVLGGVLIGLLVGATAGGRRVTLPLVLLLYAVPQAVLLPLFVLVWGIGPAAKIAFGVSHGIFPVILSMVAGIRAVDARLMGSARAMGASRLQIMRHVVLPAMIPTLFTGLRLGMTVTLLGILLAELYVSVSGIGAFALTFGQAYDPAPLFALIATLALIALALNEAVRLIEARLTRWRG